MRKIFFWLHLTAGTMAGIVILIMSVTGVLLMYQRQITAWADWGLRVEPAGRRLTAADQHGTGNQRKERSAAKRHAAHATRSPVPGRQTLTSAAINKGVGLISKFCQGPST